LVHHITFTDSVCDLKEAVSQGTFSMVYVSDNAKVADVLHVRFTSIFKSGKSSSFQAQFF
jgi:hypothetical protein